MSRRFFYNLLTALPVALAASFGLTLWQHAGNLPQFNLAGGSFTLGGSLPAALAQTCTDPAGPGLADYVGQIYYNKCSSRFRVWQGANNGGAGGWADLGTSASGSGSTLWAQYTTPTGTKDIYNVVGEPATPGGPNTGNVWAGHGLIAGVTQNLGSTTADPNAVTLTVNANGPENLVYGVVSDQSSLGTYFLRFQTYSAVAGAPGTGVYTDIFSVTTTGSVLADMLFAPTSVSTNLLCLNGICRDRWSGASTLDLLWHSIEGTADIENSNTGSVNVNGEFVVRQGPTQQNWNAVAGLPADTGAIGDINDMWNTATATGTIAIGVGARTGVSGDKQKYMIIKNTGSDWSWEDAQSNLSTAPTLNAVWGFSLGEQVEAWAVGGSTKAVRYGQQVGGMGWTEYDIPDALGTSWTGSGTPDISGVTGSADGSVIFMTMNSTNASNNFIIRLRRGAGGALTWDKVNFTLSKPVTGAAFYPTAGAYLTGTSSSDSLYLMSGSYLFKCRGSFTAATPPTLNNTTCSAASYINYLGNVDYLSPDRMWATPGGNYAIGWTQGNQDYFVYCSDFKDAQGNLLLPPNLCNGTWRQLSANSGERAQDIVGIGSSSNLVIYGLFSNSGAGQSYIRASDIAAGNLGVVWTQLTQGPDLMGNFALNPSGNLAGYAATINKGQMYKITGAYPYYAMSLVSNGMSRKLRASWFSTTTGVAVFVGDDGAVLTHDSSGWNYGPAATFTSGSTVQDLRLVTGYTEGSKTVVFVANNANLYRGIFNTAGWTWAFLGKWSDLLGTGSVEGMWAQPYPKHITGNPGNPATPIPDLVVCLSNELNGLTSDDDFAHFNRRLLTNSNSGGCNTVQGSTDGRTIISLNGSHYWISVNSGASFSYYQLNTPGGGTITGSTSASSSSTISATSLIDPLAINGNDITNVTAYVISYYSGAPPPARIYECVHLESSTNNLCTLRAPSNAPLHSVGAISGATTIKVAAAGDNDTVYAYTGGSAATPDATGYSKKNWYTVGADSYHQQLYIIESTRFMMYQAVSLSRRGNATVENGDLNVQAGDLTVRGGNVYVPVGDLDAPGNKWGSGATDGAKSGTRTIPSGVSSQPIFTSCPVGQFVKGLYMDIANNIKGVECDSL